MSWYLVEGYMCEFNPVTMILKTTGNNTVWSLQRNDFGVWQKRCITTDNYEYSCVATDMSDKLEKIYQRTNSDLSSNDGKFFVAAPGHHCWTKIPGDTTNRVCDLNKMLLGYLVASGSVHVSKSLTYVEKEDGESIWLQKHYYGGPRVEIVGPLRDGLEYLWREKHRRPAETKMFSFKVGSNHTAKYTLNVQQAEEVQKYLDLKREEHDNQIESMAQEILYNVIQVELYKNS